MKVITDVWKSFKRPDDGKHASCEICGEKQRWFNICAPETLAFTAPIGVQCTDTNSKFKQTNKRLYKRHLN